MKVWLLWYTDVYNERAVRGVFSSDQDAHDFANSIKGFDKTYWVEVEEVLQQINTK